MDKNWEKLKKVCSKSVPTHYWKIDCAVEFRKYTLWTEDKKKFSKSAGTEQNLDSKTIKHLDNGLSRNVCIDQNKSGRLNYFYWTKK